MYVLNWEMASRSSTSGWHLVMCFCNYEQAASVGLVGVATMATHAGQLLRVYRVEQRGFADFAERPIVSRSSLVIVNAGDMLYICL